MTERPRLEVVQSHGRLRTELRGDAPLPSEPTDNDSTNGRFVKGNGAWRRRRAKLGIRGVATMNPEACADWLRDHVKDGADYAMQLAARFPDPALVRLVGDCADAHAIYRALLAQAAAGDKGALAEARAWLKEHRATLRELSSLSAIASSGKPESVADLRARILTTKGNDR